MTLTEFLLARIAEDERAAKILLEHDQRPLLSVALTVNHPARFLAECEAKRRIVGIYHYVSMSEPDEGHSSVPLGGDGPETYYEAVQHLAAVYADHPDYDEAWRA